MDFAKRYAALGGSIEKLRMRKTIRANTLKMPQETLCARLTAKGVKLEKVPFLANGFYAESKFSLGASPEYLLGLLHLQEAASQIPAEVLNPGRDDTVLDMCASPGSKTSQLAQIMGNRGTLIALELKRERIAALENNLERLGITNTAVHNINALDVKRLGMKFTKILLDAPCSGNYAAEPGWFEKRTLEGIMRNAALQKTLLAAAVSVLEPGGIIVYSTCSLEPEEDEENIKWAQERLLLKPEQFQCIGDSRLAGTKRLWPGKTMTQGFFVAKLRK